MKRFFSYLSLLLINLALYAQGEFTHPSILSFEDDNTIFTPTASKLSNSNDHFKHGNQSLKWSWERSGAKLEAKLPITWTPDPKDAPDPSTYSFVYWVYSEKPMPEAKLRFSFLKDGKVCSWFDYGLDFIGWRSAWVAFERDMKGKPEYDMDEIKIEVINSSNGTLYFDLMIPSSLQDLRQHTADTQATFINKGTNNHWLVNEKCSHYQFDIPLVSPTLVEISEIDSIENRYRSFYLDGRKPLSLERLINEYNRFEIVKNSDGTLRGKPLFFQRWGETYFSLGHPRNTNIFASTVATLKEANQMIFQLGLAYHKGPKNEKPEILNMYLTMVRYMFDQGLVYGASLGTIHHLGYSMLQFQPGLFIMKDALYEAGLGEQAQKAMEWFSNAAEVKVKPPHLGMDIDIFNTTLMGRLGSILMLQNGDYKTTYMRCYKRWLENGFAPSPGLGATFKVDYSVFHHCNNYPAYARDGMRGGVEGVYVLSKTSFAVSREAHNQLKQSLLTMRFYCNLTNWPISMSGRHPKGTEGLVPSHFGLLALAGSPDRTQDIDSDLAGAYIRLVQGVDDKYTNAFAKAGIIAEKSPVGAQAMPYASVFTQRRDNWAVTVRGHSRYIWAAETYERANLFGRYLAHGNLQIVANGNPVSNTASGYQQKGWDWNYWWGTTATVQPIKDLRSTVLNVDVHSGNEEMLYSDEAFAGPLVLEGKNGMYAFKLHEHDKYNGSLRANKSYFFFDNRVVCLGTNIQSKIQDYPTVTTLFQEHIEDKNNASIFVNKKRVDTFPYEWSGKGNTSLTDAHGNSYFVNNGELFVRRSHQYSLDQATGEDTENDFTVAAITHGNAPSDGKYEYAIAIQSTEQPKYKVLQSDNKAHIVEDKATSNIGYAIFESGTLNKNKYLQKSSLPCLVMISPKNKDLLTLSLADPDLRFYEGPSDDIFDENGKRVERSIYSRPWKNNESIASTVQITLHGSWQLEGDSEYCKVISNSNNITILEFNCKHGLSREVVLNQL